MANNGFVSADIEKLVQFAADSENAVREFNAIKEQFRNVNATLLSKWKGEGADAYRYETDHILEEIGGIEEVLKSINEEVLKDIKEAYVTLDDQLAEFNRNPQGA
ncbi:MAG: hypothetical protein IJ567_07830 [Lachnospiraceae bacterium]|nr:hypothetical protein [Lachnospiraceae bacterium]